MKSFLLFYVVLTTFQSNKKNLDMNKYAVKNNIGETGILYTPIKYKAGDTIWVKKYNP